VKLKAEPTFLFKGLRRQAHSWKSQNTRSASWNPAFLFNIYLFFFQDTRHSKAEVCMLQLSMSWVWQPFIVQHLRVTL